MAERRAKHTALNQSGTALQENQAFAGIDQLNPIYDEAMKEGCYEEPEYDDAPPIGQAIQLNEDNYVALDDNAHNVEMI